MQHNRNPIAGLLLLLLALCAGSSLAAQSIIEVQAVVNGILSGADVNTSPHLDHNHDGLVNVVDAQHLVDQMLSPALRFEEKNVTFSVNSSPGVMLIAKGGAGEPYSFTVIAGAPPPGMIAGMVVSPRPPLPDLYTFQIVGTPTQDGVYPVTIELEDAIGDKFVGTVTITVVP